ncbi:MAG: hypothetical protein ACETVO_05170, partial [bacterium]
RNTGTQYLIIEPDAGLLKILPNHVYNNRQARLDYWMLKNFFNELEEIVVKILKRGRELSKIIKYCVPGIVGGSD